MKRHQPRFLGGGSLRLRPDYVCRPESSTTAAVIVEVKRLGTDLTKRIGQTWSTAPSGQLHRYLTSYRGAGDGTWGLLTNGTEWIVVQRRGDDVSPYEFRDPVEAATLLDVRALLAPIRDERSTRHVRPSKAPKPVLPDWLTAVAVAETPRDFVHRVAPDAPDSPKLQGELFALEPVGDEGDADADNFAAVQLVDGDAEVHLVAMEMAFPDGLMSPQDITEALRPNLADLTGRVIGVAWVRVDEARKCRGFASDGERLVATPLIEPALPGSRAERQFGVLAKHGADLENDKVLKELSSEPLHQKFHEEVDCWFRAGPGRPAELRHLTRILFVWLLQQRSVLPDHGLWRQGVRPSRPFEVHEHVGWLFSEVLAIPAEQRAQQDDDWRQSLVDSVPFVNGSMFNRVLNEEGPAPIEDSMYLDPDDGLLSILSRYDWTLSDRTGYESEAAIDPSMLGSLFERLMLTTEGPRIEGKNLKMPKGTYYTPADVADEMTADALAGWLCGSVPALEWASARALVHPTPIAADWVEWGSAEKEAALAAIESVTVFDPCSGSGEFTLSVLHALWRSVARLRGLSRREVLLEPILERQIYAADIHPLAALITRLRLLVALVDARTRRGTSGAMASKPLPNLETRCIVANTLCVELTPQVQIGGKEWNDGIAELRDARELWVRAYSPDDKSAALEAEKEARQRLRSVGRSLHGDSDLGWLDLDFLSEEAEAVHFDVRSLFPAPEGGWDIVIGNPPYQKPDPADRERGLRLGYVGATANLYLMFLELALAATRPGGCITMVVPHSIVFRRGGAFGEMRRALELGARRVDVRTYDNMPQPLFPRLPWLKNASSGQQNRQRCTILTVLKDSPGWAEEERGGVTSCGVIRLNAADRQSVLKAVRRGTVQPAYSVQWSQAPTEELRELLERMRRDFYVSRAPQRILPRKVTFPATAMYFISCLPLNRLENPRRKEFALEDDEFFWPWVGLYNSHLFHAYWLMVGDAFDVTLQEYGTVRPPEGWQDSRQRGAIDECVQELMAEDVVDACRVMKKNRGEQHNVNFHLEDSPGPEVVERLDRLLLAAYGLPHDPLMEQMRVVRASSAHLL